VSTVYSLTFVRNFGPCLMTADNSRHGIKTIEQKILRDCNTRI